MPVAFDQVLKSNYLFDTNHIRRCLKISTNQSYIRQYNTQKCMSHGAVGNATTTVGMSTCFILFQSTRKNKINCFSLTFCCIMWLNSKMRYNYTQENGLRTFLQTILFIPLSYCFVLDYASWMNKLKVSLLYRCM